MGKQYWISSQVDDLDLDEDVIVFTEEHKQNFPEHSFVHVIEYSAYQSALERIKELENSFRELFKLFDKDLLVEIDKAKVREHRLVEALKLSMKADAGLVHYDKFVQARNKILEEI